MSGAGEEDDLRAGEYVLGLLDPEESERVKRDAGSRPELALAIARWEMHLAPLLAQGPSVDPPAALWTRLEASAFGTPAGLPGSPRQTPWNSLLLWRGAALVLALAAGIAGIALLRQPATLPVPVAALLPTNGQQPAIVASALPDGRLALRPVAQLSVPSGHELEVWSLPAGATRPVSLGLLRPGGVVLAADRAPHGAGKILVSLEPRGGSPTGLPTGPVLWGGTLGPGGG